MYDSNELYRNCVTPIIWGTTNHNADGAAHSAGASHQGSGAGAAPALMTDQSGAAHSGMAPARLVAVVMPVVAVPGCHRDHRKFAGLAQRQQHMDQPPYSGQRLSAVAAAPR